ncbi:MAG: hypothetical protein ACXACK_11735 [Candidatus Hodarchaeales archaeon]|jgi:hypothetical protein
MCLILVDINIGVRIIVNISYMTAGFLTTLMTVAHAFWGEKFIIPDLKQTSELKEVSKIGLYIPWHQITNTLLMSGLALLIISFNDTIQGIDILGMFIGFVIAGNYVVFILISLVKDPALMGQSIPQLIIFTLMIILIILGVLF